LKESGVTHVAGRPIEDIVRTSSEISGVVNTDSFEDVGMQVWDHDVPISNMRKKTKGGGGQSNVTEVHSDNIPETEPEPKPAPASAPEGAPTPQKKSNEILQAIADTKGLTNPAAPSGTTTIGQWFSTIEDAGTYSVNLDEFKNLSTYDSLYESFPSTVIRLSNGQIFRRLPTGVWVNTAGATHMQKPFSDEDVTQVMVPKNTDSMNKAWFNLLSKPLGKPGTTPNFPSGTVSEGSWENLVHEHNVAPVAVNGVSDFGPFGETYPSQIIRMKDGQLYRRIKSGYWVNTTGDTSNSAEPPFNPDDIYQIVVPGTTTGPGFPLFWAALKDKAS
jgi:hypothetical protein